uniref:DinB family protein n=1 Tax=Roseihalotalea indica TaxID=2867963 RepID=A0AA49GMB1_9BACT|nr:DinB family protein [Tunicatimonas sp. TK19036]
MSPIEILLRQTEDAYGWVNKLLTSVPKEHWDDITPNVDTNVTWQAGHLIMSFYFHSIMVIRGHQMDLLQKIPVQEYDSYFTVAEPVQSVGKTNPETLESHLALMQEKSLEVIRSLSVAELDDALEPTKTPHPIAKTKYEALDWNIKHTMWHCGQLGIIKRALHGRYDFGLNR